ncbi:coiled-coil domain-containing protein 28B [Microcaecilia unicolor]|uniref:Coiled-coil domain-containing protein 28B n=1 Tax=Microcaecilia unicolor TaxID=1415580 RepID=A0A6P7ZCS0_9AMPH|nr:coiled-coil domain-containing protein 28B [Microcaecilia unicolor]
MEEKKKRRNPKACLVPAVSSGGPRKLPTPAGKTGAITFGLPLPPSPKQKAKFRRVNKERVKVAPPAGAMASLVAPLQHSFLTDVSDVCEMESGLLNLLSDFHSGKLQAFGKACSFEQLEHVREMQGKLARLHFSLDVCVDDQNEDQNITVADRNLEQLLSNLEELSASIQKLHLAENQDPQTLSPA